MTFLITSGDRAAFRRCRRQWDFGARTRQDLEPLRPPGVPNLDRALRDALAIYYYPGMWDWDRAVTLPLAVQGLDRALARQQERCGHSPDSPLWRAWLEQAQRLLAGYVEWAPAVDQFAPVLVEADYEVTVLDPAKPSAGLATAAGAVIRYYGRIDLLAVDAADAYWIVRHRVVDGDWPPTEQLAADEETLAACWAWEQFYPGMAITGTIWNELRPLSPESAQTASGQPRRAGRHWLRRRAAPSQRAVRQHEPSGGGRSIPQHRRMYVRAREPQRPEPIEQRVADGFRRTWLRRGPADVAAAGRRLGADAAEMARSGLPVYPNPSDANCPPCPYLKPCLALSAGEDAGPIVRAGYRRRPPEGPEEGRLGGGAWAMGRGAAPPKFRRSQGG